VQVLQAGGHACLATSVADNVQVTVLEALSRGIPTVSTRVGDAPSYYFSSSIRQLCVPPRDPEATADALFDLASSYDSLRSLFAANAAILRVRHASAGEALARLLVEALPSTRSAERPVSVR
jgi:glycosyltransferase involved in cell wall biosynthesis